jgi:hypothetical protein
MLVGAATPAGSANLIDGRTSIFSRWTAEGARIDRDVTDGSA